jgi:hypothetical protein
MLFMIGHADMVITKRGEREDCRKADKWEKSWEK